MTGFLKKLRRRFGFSTNRDAANSGPEFTTNGPSASRETGYGPTNVGAPASAHPDYDELGSSGFGPTDTRGPIVTALRMKGPGGMAATGRRSQGNGDADDGIERTGWAPADSSHQDA